MKHPLKNPLQFDHATYAQSLFLILGENNKKLLRLMLVLNCSIVTKKNVKTNSSEMFKIKGKNWKKTNINQKNKPKINNKSKKTKTHSKKMEKQRLNRRLKNKKYGKTMTQPKTQQKTQSRTQICMFSVFFPPCSADFPSCSFKITILQPSFPLFDFLVSYFLHAFFFAKTIKRKNPDFNRSVNRRLNPGLESACFSWLSRCSADFPSFFLQNQMLQPSFRCFFFRYTTQQ